FKPSPVYPTLRNHVTNLQISFPEVILDVSQGDAYRRVFHCQELGTPPSNDALGCDSLGNVGRGFTVDQTVKQRRRFVGHALEIMPHAGQRHLDAVANNRIIVDTQNGNLIWDLNTRFDAGVNDVRGDAVVVTKDPQWMFQRANRVDDPPPAKGPVQMPIEATAASSVKRQ